MFTKWTSWRLSEAANWLTLDNKANVARDLYFGVHLEHLSYGDLQSTGTTETLPLCAGHSQSARLCWKTLSTL